MRRVTAIFGMIGLAVLLGGCGGSDPIKVTGVIQQSQAGHQVTYAVTGTYTPFSGAGSPITGTAVATTYVDNAIAKYGGRRLKDITEMNVTMYGNPVSIVATGLYEQVSDGTIYSLGDSSGNIIKILVDSIGAPIGNKSPLVVGDQWSYIAHLSDSTTVTYNNAVLALENVNGHMAYKVQSTSGTGANGSSYEWIVSEWGCPIKMISTTIDANGTTVLTMNYTSKNF